MSEQLQLNFDCPVIAPDEPEAKPEPDYSKKPGAVWNGKIWACDEDVGI